MVHEATLLLLLCIFQRLARQGPAHRRAVAHLHQLFDHLCGHGLRIHDGVRGCFGQHEDGVKFAAKPPICRSATLAAEVPEIVAQVLIEMVIHKVHRGLL